MAWRLEILIIVNAFEWRMLVGGHDAMMGGRLDDPLQLREINSNIKCYCYSRLSTFHSYHGRGARNLLLKQTISMDSARHAQASLQIRATRIERLRATVS